MKGKYSEIYFLESESEKKKNQSICSVRSKLHLKTANFRLHLYSPYIYFLLEQKIWLNM